MKPLDSLDCSAVISPKGMRIAVSGDILALSDAKAAWAKHFHAVKVRSTG